MITIKKTFTILFIVAIISACESSTEQNKTASTEVLIENVIVADYAIEGMVCAMGCAATIEKDVLGMTGIVVSEVDYEAGKAHFEFDESIVSEKEIISKIESIADGQYKVGEWVEQTNTTSVDAEDVAENNEETITEVSLPSFEIPNLFTLLLDQI
ncbi:MAG: hypothetical protein COB15_16200 [Flavobacteriales bacterium]|nr:MAG: hypothetical protein COB15_16200 [Flavobacteriales bacterium]